MTVEIAKEIGAGSVVRDGVTRSITFTPELLEQYNQRLAEKGLVAGTPGVVSAGGPCAHSMNDEFEVGEDDDGDPIFWCAECGRLKATNNNAELVPRRAGGSH